MADWQARKVLGDQHEQRVIVELQRRGWTVQACGQGTFLAPIQQALRTSGSALRQFPDMLAARAQDLVAIDAKSRMRSDTGRYAISSQCLQAGLQFIGINAPVPLYYVMGDTRTGLSVLTPAEVAAYRSIAHPHPGGAYFLVDASLARPFDDVFGAGRDTLTA
ncbi:hypothetical protein [Actinomadura sp. 6N118]|uniref:hypothetical protein n=1 Tax=Actinomadura sp. 6N118 TaxID=3375151 RepID=UPI003799B4BA